MVYRTVFCNAPVKVTDFGGVKKNKETLETNMRRKKLHNFRKRKKKLFQ